MNLLDELKLIPTRVRAAAHVFRKGYPISTPAMKALANQAGFDPEDTVPWFTSAWGYQDPQWSPVDFRTFVEEGFELNSLIQSALIYKARSKMLVPLRAYIGDPRKPDLLEPGHPLQRLCLRPNRWQGWAEFSARHELFFNLGNSFILLIRPVDGGLPRSMYTLRPDLVRIIPEDWGVKGYLYLKDKKNPLAILAEDMIHIKYPNNLLDPMEGFGFGLPPTSIAQSTDVDNEITKFLRLFFKNGAMPPGILTYDVPLQKTDIQTIRTRWRELYGGAQNWLEPGILDRGGKYQKVGSSFQEMGFGDIDERDESRILGPFGVPPILLGTRMGLNRSTYSNYQQARTAYWEDTAEPELQLGEDEFRYYLQSTDGGFVSYDRSRVPALRDKIPGLVSAVKQLWEMGTPLNQAVRTVGLAMEDVPGGDVGYIRMGLVPVAVELQDPNATMEDAPEAEEDTERDEDLDERDDEDEEKPKAYIRAWRRDHPLAKTIRQKCLGIRALNILTRPKPVIFTTKDNTALDDEEQMANLLLEDYISQAEGLIDRAPQLTRVEFEQELLELTEATGDELVFLGSGQTPEELTNTEIRLLIEQENVNGNSAADFSADYYHELDVDHEAAKDNAKDRLLLWAGITAGIFYLSRLFRKDNPDLVWEYTPGKDHCHDCTSLNGVIRDAITWLSSGVRPRSYALECRGFYCGCRFLLV